MQARLTDDECRAIVESTVEMVVVFDTSGTVRWVNDAAVALLGGALEDHVGRNVVEYAHPDELERALQTLEISADFGAVPGATNFLLRRVDGSYLTVELTTGVLPGPVPLRFLLGRGADHNVALADTLHRLISVDDLAVPLRTALDTVGWKQVGSHVVLTWRDADGVDRTVSTGLPTELSGVDAPDGSVWAEVRRTGAAQRSDTLDGLDVASRAAAEAAGLGGWWIEPVAAPGAPALLAVWTRAGGMPPGLHGQGMQLAGELVSVILRFADQQRRLDEAATRDALTGLANRRAFFEALDRAGPGAVLYCDLDRFKPVNDELGHHAGDQLLAVVAARLRTSVRDGDLVARLGGDEFAVLCPGADAGEAERIAARIERAVAEPVDLGGRTVRIGITVGSAHAEGGLDLAAVESADRALYARKGVAGRAGSDGVDGAGAGVEVEGDAGLVAGQLDDGGVGLDRAPP